MYFLLSGTTWSSVGIAVEKARGTEGPNYSPRQGPGTCPAIHYYIRCTVPSNWAVPEQADRTTHIIMQAEPENTSLVP